MSRLYVFADEAGCFGFHRKGNSSKYFIVCTIALERCDISHALTDLRRDMLWRRLPLGDGFHAAPDKQLVRDEVFTLICQHDFSIQATIMEKSKAQPQVRTTKDRFYKYGWYYHFLHGMKPTITPYDELLVTAASVEHSKKKQGAFTSSVNDVVNQTISRSDWHTSFHPSATDPCLQVADYCTWAIQRKWEQGDARSYDLIKDRISYEYDLWGHGSTHYY